MKLKEFSQHHPVIITIITLLLLVFVIPFGSTGFAEEQQKIKIGYSALRISLPVFVASNKGFFSDEGLDVELVRFETAQPLMSSLVAGNIHIAGYTALPITLNSMLRSKTSLYFLTALYEDQDHPISYVIVPSDTPPTFRIADLKGKKVGILPTVAYRVWFEEILRFHGLDPSTVQLRPIAPAMAPTSIKSRQVDALFTNDPAATAVLQQKLGRLLNNRAEVPNALGGRFVFGSFNMTKDYADRNPEIANKIVRALDRAVDFVNTHQKEAKNIMKGFVHPSQQPYVDYYPDAVYDTTSAVDPSRFQAIANKYHELGIIKEPMQIENLVLTHKNSDS